jgi:hypothetical protein
LSKFNSVDNNIEEDDSEKNGLYLNPTSKSPNSKFTDKEVHSKNTSPNGVRSTHDPNEPNDSNNLLFEKV